MVWFIDNAVSLGQNITAAASTDPISAALVLVGTLLIVFSGGAFGALTLGAVLETFVPDTSTPRQRRPR